MEDGDIEEYHYLFAIIFYKNIITVFWELYFAFYNGYSGQIYFTDYLPMLYNAVFTSWPWIFTFVFDRDVGFENSMNIPKLYQAGQAKYYFGYLTFWKWIFLAIFHGWVAYFLPMYGMYGPYDSSGKTWEHWVSSTVSFSIILHVVTYKLFIDWYFLNKINLLMALISIFLYYIVLILGSVPTLANLIQPEANGVFFILVTNPKFWFLIIIGPFIWLLPDITIVTFRRMFFKTPADLIAECEKKRIPVPLKSNEVTRAKNYEMSDWLKPDPNSKAKINESDFDNINDPTPDENELYKTNKDATASKFDLNDTGFLSKVKPVKKRINDEATYGKELSNSVAPTHFKQRNLDQQCKNFYLIIRWWRNGS